MTMKNKKVYDKLLNQCINDEKWIEDWKGWMEIKEKWLNEEFKKAMKSGKIKIL